VESTVKGNRRKVGVPDGVDRVDEEATSETSKTVTNEVGGETDEDLVTKVLRPRHVEEARDVLDEDDVVGVRSSETDVCHDSDDHVLLHVEGTGVEGDLPAEDLERPPGQDCLEQLASRVTQNLRDVAAYRDRRVAE